MVGKPVGRVDGIALGKGEGNDEGSLVGFAVG